MNEAEQIQWCQRERATVWFGENYVKVKVTDFSTIKGTTLLEAIQHIEKLRKEREEIWQAYRSLK
jgi:hypothetical protein